MPKHTTEIQQLCGSLDRLTSKLDTLTNVLLHHSFPTDDSSDIEDDVDDEDIAALQLMIHTLKA